MRRRAAETDSETICRQVKDRRSDEQRRAAGTTELAAIRAAAHRAVDAVHINAPWSFTTDDVRKSVLEAAHTDLKALEVDVASSQVEKACKVAWQWAFDSKTIAGRVRRGSSNRLELLCRAVNWSARDERVCGHCGCVYFPSMPGCTGGLSEWDWDATVPNHEHILYPSRDINDWWQPVPVVSGGSFCCSHGVRMHQKLRQPPQAYVDLLRRSYRLARGGSFYNVRAAQHDRWYNNLFNFAGTGFTPGPNVGGRSFMKPADFGFPKFLPAAVTIQGVPYHRVGPLADDADGSPLIGGMSWYITPEGRSTRAASFNLNLQTVTDLKTLLSQHNRIVALVEQPRTERITDNLHMVMRYDAPSAALDSSEDAMEQPDIAVTFDESLVREGTDKSRAVVFHRKGTGDCCFVGSLSRWMEPLCYPLLFFCGDLGWGKDPDGTCGTYPAPSAFVEPRPLSCAEYTRKMILTEPLFRLLGRLSSEWLVNQWLRIQEDRLLYLRFNYNPNRRLASRSAASSHTAGAGRVILPSSFSDGPRKKRQLVADAMYIYRRLGAPTFFITITMDSKWHEVRRHLHPGQTAYDRPALTCRVFERKVDAIIKWIEQGGVMATVVDPEDSSMVYRMHVVEFQKRGLPHVHLVIKFKPEPPLHVMHRIVTAHYPVHSSFWAISDDELLTDEVVQLLVRVFRSTATGDRWKCDSFTFSRALPDGRKSAIVAKLEDASGHAFRTLQPSIDRWWRNRRRSHPLVCAFIRNIHAHDRDGINWVHPGFKFHVLYPPGSHSYVRLERDVRAAVGDELDLPYSPEPYSLHPQHIQPACVTSAVPAYQKLWHWWTVHLHQVVIDKFGLRHLKCIPGRCYPKGGSQRLCKGGYPFEQNTETKLDARGYVNHIRPNRHSCTVVPHSFELLLVGGCHINVEWSMKVNVMFYLYKYLWKPADASFVKLRSDFYDAKCKNDEINTFRYHRYVSACEAAWRVLEFEIHPKRYPSVAVLPIHLHGQDLCVYDDEGPTHRPVPVAVRDRAVQHAREHDVPIDNALDAVDGQTEPTDHDFDDDPERKCTKLEQYFLRPPFVVVRDKAARSMHRIHRDRGYQILEHDDPLAEHYIAPDGHVLVDTRKLLYTDYFDFFSIGTSKLADTTVDLTHAKNTVIHRVQPKLHRLQQRTSRSGDAFYCRLLLSYRPSPSLHFKLEYVAAPQDSRLRQVWEALLTVDGEVCGSCQCACIALGFAGDGSEHMECFAELVREGHVGRMLRQLFVALVLNSDADAELLWYTYGEVRPNGAAAPPLWIDLHERRLQRGMVDAPSLDVARNECLVDLKNRLESQSSRTLTDFLDVVVHDMETELSRERSLHRPDVYAAYLTANLRMLEGDDNSEQRNVFRTLTGYDGPLQHLRSACEREQLPTDPLYPFPPSAPPLYVDGMSGRGKTAVMKLVTAYFRMHRKIVLCVATTGVAALNHTIGDLVYGSTAHSMFGIGIVHGAEILMTTNVPSNISMESQRAQLLRSADLVLWDEMPMANKLDLNCVDWLLQEVRGDDRPFGGVTFAGFGDSHQIPPVVERAARADVEKMTIKNSRHWRTGFTHLKLHAPKRDASDLEYSSFVDSVGQGTLPQQELSDEDVPVVVLPNIRSTTSLDEAMRFVFPTVASMTDRSRAVLCTHNYAVDDVNEHLLRRVPGARRTYYSSDAIKGDEDKDDGCEGEDPFDNSDFLHAVTGRPGQTPPHALKLRVGAMVMCMRNLSKADKLMNGTRCVVAQLLRYSIIVRTEDGKRHCLGKICFEHRLCDGVVMVRKQLPVRLAYAMTVHKVQGRTMSCAAVDLRNDPFAHGQLYVALGRCRTSDSILVVTQPHRQTPDGPATVNVVHQELLPAAFVSGMDGPSDPCPHVPPLIDHAESAWLAAADSWLVQDDYGIRGERAVPDPIANETSDASMLQPHDA